MPCRRLIPALVLFAAGLGLIACSEETDCDRLQLCCDALVSTSTVFGCEPLPLDDERCRMSLDALPEFARPLPLPEACVGI